MEKELIELFIYYILALEEEGTENYSISGCVKAIEKALSYIENEGIEKWNNSLDKFPRDSSSIKETTKIKGIISRRI